MNDKKIEYLNYNLSEDTPLYGNGHGIQFKPEKEIAILRAIPRFFDFLFFLLFGKIINKYRTHS